MKAPPIIRFSLLPPTTNSLLPFTSRIQLTKPLFSTSTSSFSSTTTKPQPYRPNRVLSPLRTPPSFHDSLRLCSANNTLLLLLFTTSTCTPCRTITPLLTNLVQTRQPIPSDRFSNLAFAEVELDSPDTSNGNMMTEVGVEFGITSLPTLMGMGGRRAERVTERLVDTRVMSDKTQLGEWVDAAMEKGDPFGVDGGSGGGIQGLFGRLFSRGSGSG